MSRRQSTRQYSISVLLCSDTAKEEHASIATSSVPKLTTDFVHTPRERPFAIMAVYELIKLVSLMTLCNGVCKIVNFHLLSRIHSVDADLCREVGFKLYAFAFKLKPDESCQEACAPKFRALENIIKPGFGGYDQRPMTGLPTTFDWLDPCMFNGRICMWHKFAEPVTGVILANPFCKFQYSALCASTSRTAGQSCLCQRTLKLYRVYRVPIKQKGTGLSFDCDPDQICQRLQDRLKPSWVCHGSVVIRQQVICRNRRNAKWCRCNTKILLDKAVDCEEILLPFTLVSVMCSADQLFDRENIRRQAEYAVFVEAIRITRLLGQSVGALDAMQSFQLFPGVSSFPSAAVIHGAPVSSRVAASAVVTASRPPSTSLSLSPAAAAAEETAIVTTTEDSVSSSLLRQRAEFAAELGMWLAGEDMLDFLEKNQNHVKTAINQGQHFGVVSARHPLAFLNASLESTAADIGSLNTNLSAGVFPTTTTKTVDVKDCLTASSSVVAFETASAAQESHIAVSNNERLHSWSPSPFL